MSNNTLADLNAEVNARLTRLPAMPGGARKARALNRCECGCNGLTGNRFVPGHDARLHGWKLRVQRALLVPGGDVWAQLAWIEANASAGEAMAVAKALGLDMADVPAAEVAVNE